MITQLIIEFSQFYKITFRLQHIEHLDFALLRAKLACSVWHWRVECPGIPRYRDGEC